MVVMAAVEHSGAEEKNAAGESGWEKRIRTPSAQPSSQGKVSVSDPARAQFGGLVSLGPGGFCQGQTCKASVTDPAELGKLLRK